MALGQGADPVGDGGQGRVRLPGPSAASEFNPLTPTWVQCPQCGRRRRLCCRPARLNVKFKAVADEKLGVSGGFAEAQVSRRLDVKMKKLGGGKLKFTVKGAGPVKVYVLDSSGYEIPNVKPKRANKAGIAIFGLGNRHGEFSYYVDVGALADLYWEDPRHTFKL